MPCNKKTSLTCYLHSFQAAPSTGKTPIIYGMCSNTLLLEYFEEREAFWEKPIPFKSFRET